MIQWWLVNGDAFEAKKWEDTRPLSEKISYAHPKDDTLLPNKEPMAEGAQPPYGSPAWELPESFEAWAERIVDPKRRNLDFVALSWDGTKVIVHPAKSLDPKARPQERESRKTPAPRNSPEPETDGVFEKGISWIIVVVVLLIAISVIRWLKRKSTGKI